MPRKDPTTGCTVMTTGEFWAGEAEREGLGRSPGELMSEFYKDLEREEQKERLQYFQPKVALNWLRELVKDEYQDLDDEYAPEFADITEVLKVWDVRYTSNSSGTQIQMLAEVKCGQDVRWILAYYDYWRGNMVDPPYVGVDWSWIPLIG